MANGKLILGAVIVLILVVAGAALLLGTGPSPGSTTTASYNGSTFNEPVMITDPAQVPAGTSALVFTYSNVQLNETGPSGSQWVNATGSGSVNLIAIMNKTQVMGYANVAANTSITQVRMYVNTVQITVNGTVYSVPVAYRQLTLSISGNANAAAGSGVLIDYAPTVSPAFNSNSTAFVRVPSGRAVVTGNVNASASTNVGAVFPITATARASLAVVTPSLVISNATVSTSGNTTSISVTVKNNGNQSVTLSNLVVYGAQNVSTTASLSASMGAGMAAMVSQSILAGRAVAGLVNSNAQALVSVGINVHAFAMQNFAANSSGSLVLVSNYSASQTGGYSLAAGSSVTLSYSGVAQYNSGMFMTTPTSGSEYRMYVGSNAGASAVTNVVAT
ncbi:MAG: hypothetical protein KGI04_02065 [Candidatus Micrarchaeota archaeon]|nr:hypothetical protein [Candidatus Micrarchaeota archaeon]